MAETNKIDNSPQTVGEYIRMLRQRANPPLTQKALAAEFAGDGKERRSDFIQQWEAGVNYPQEANLKRLIEIFVAKGVFTPGQELLEAQKLWQLVREAKLSIYAGFDESWFKSLLVQADVSSKTNQTAAASNSPVVERGLMLKPKGEGEVIKWSAFQRHEIVAAGQFNTFLTVRLTDAVTMMWQVCQDLDPTSRRIVVKPNGLTDAYFKLEYSSSKFSVICERNWDSGIRMILTTENLPQLVVTITIKAEATIATLLVNRFKRQPGAQALEILQEW